RHMLLFRVESLRSPETVRLAVAGHRRLLDRLRHRDVPGAEAAIRQHLADAREAIRQSTFPEHPAG
ncbi:MAG: FCD domain-containing protein, partial [Deferrisomatales bacterium]